jgi:hypothetical protein
MNFWSAFGLVWNSDIALNHFAVGDGVADVIVRRVAQLPERKVVKAANRGALRADGIRFVCEGQAIFDMVNGNRVDYVTGHCSARSDAIFGRSFGCQGDTGRRPFGRIRLPCYPPPMDGGTPRRRPPKGGDACHAGEAPIRGIACGWGD